MAARGRLKQRTCGFEAEAAWLRKRVGAIIAGIDEAGRGPFAGPVVAAAVILPMDDCPRDLRDGLDDSKKLSAERRDLLYASLMACPGAVIGIGRAEVAEIDSINILNATYRAMARAVEALGQSIDIALVDGNRPPPLPPHITIETLIGGDGLSLSIAAASIIAKVTRDRIMCALHEEFPVYGWNTNMGYGTAAHYEGMNRHGVTPHHRRSFAPVRDILAGVSVQSDLDMDIAAVG